MLTAIETNVTEVESTSDRSTRQSGFSLVELMITMMITIVLLAAVYTIYGSLSRSYTTQNVSAEVQQSIRAALDLMSEDIMMAGLDPQNSGNFGFESSGSNLISFRFDSADAGNLFNGARDAQEWITYEFNNGTLFQCFDVGNCNIADPQNRFIENVTGFNISYLDGSNPIQDLITDLGYADPLTGTDLNDIRQVVITITVEEAAGLDQTVSRTYTAKVKCRNMGI